LAVSGKIQKEDNTSPTPSTVAKKNKEKNGKNEEAPSTKKKKTGKEPRERDFVNDKSVNDSKYIKETRLKKKIHVNTPKERERSASKGKKRQIQVHLPHARPNP